MSEIEDAIRALQSSDLDEREAALDRIEAMSKLGMASEDVTVLIDGATQAFPPPRFNFRQYAEGLLRATWGHLSDGHVPLVVSSYPRVSMSARAGALAALATLGSEAATNAYVHLLLTHGWPERAYPPVVLPYEEEPRFPERPLPPFATGAIRGVPADVRWRFVLAYATRQMIPAALRPVLQAAAVQAAEAAVTRAASFQRAAGIAWRWDDAYADVRQETAILLDLLGYLGPSSSALAVLRRAEVLRDPRLTLFTVSSAVRLGNVPSRAAVEVVGADPETRSQLLDRLTAADRRDLFPSSQLTQDKLAESDMVQWLTFPTELGRAPDHIELMHTARVDTDDEVRLYYLFRFRTDPPHWSAEDGWMAGVSGPFNADDGPSPHGGGDTFSSFTKWDELTPDEHLAAVVELMQDWRQQHGQAEE